MSEDQGLDIRGDRKMMILEPLVCNFSYIHLLMLTLVYYKNMSIITNYYEFVTEFGKNFGKWGVIHD